MGKGNPPFTKDQTPTNEELMGGLFHQSALRLHKALMVEGIQYCRPRLRTMMASFYQDRHLRAALHDKIDYRQFYGGLIEEKKTELQEMKHKVQVMRNTLA